MRASFKALISVLVASWNRFWFQPESALPVSVFRIAFGIVMMFSLLLQFRRDYLLFYGANAVFPTASIDINEWHHGPAFDLLLLLPSEDGFRIGFLFFSALMAFLVTIGLATRFSSLMLFLCYLSLCNHFPIVLMGGDNFARIISLFLIFTPCGKRLSIDSLIKPGAPSRFYDPWAQRVIQVQLCVIYLVNVVYKFAGEQWRDGSAVYYATRLLDYTRISIPPTIDLPLISKILTWSTLALESSFVFAFWIPNKKIRYAALLSGLLFHLGLDFCFGLGPFEWFFIASLILFVSGEDLECLLKRLSRRTSNSSVSPANSPVARSTGL
jgi:hypothetical protein